MYSSDIMDQGLRQASNLRSPNVDYWPIQGSLKKPHYMDFD